MNKVFGLMIVGATSFALSACGEAASSSPSPSASSLPPTSAPTPAVAKLHVGESTMIDDIKVTVQATEETHRTQLATPPSGMSYVSVIIRYDNGSSDAIEVSEKPWTVASVDGVRHQPNYRGAREDWLLISTIMPNNFVVGSLTFEVPAGPLDLYYNQPSAPFRVVVWQIR